MKKIYMTPATTMVNVHIEQMVASSPVKTVSSNLGEGNSLNYGGAGSGSSRVKDNSYDVWDDDWSNN